MKKTLALLLAALTVAGSVVTASAETAVWEENTDYAVVGTNSAEAYSVTKESYPAVTSGQLLTGTIAQTLTKIEEGHGADQMFDGDKATYFNASDNGGFAYLILDQAYQLTEIRVAPTTAEGVKLDTHFGLMIQGSNDGENWVTIIQRGRDAQNADYRIYTPTIAEEQAYQAAGFGLKSGLDGSIWWRGNPDYAFSIYRVFDGIVGEIEFYGNPAEATDASTPEKASALDFASAHYYPGNIHEMPDSPVVTVDGSLSGTIIGAGGAWAGATYERCFNGNVKRNYDPPVEGPQCWVGLKMDQAYALTEVRILPKRDEHGRNNTLYAQVQGSVDGRNWRTLATFDEIPETQVYLSKPVTDTNGYTYFRYVNCGTRQSSCADLLLFGAPAAAAEPFTAGPVIVTHDYFGGEIELAAAKNTIVDTEISGTPICGRYYYGWTDRDAGMEAAFDGDLTTGYGSINGRLGVQQWVGLKADVTTVANTVMFNRANFDDEGNLTGVSNIDDDYYFQGSVDGENWVDLAVFAEGVDTADAEGWLTKTVEDTNGYNYFRMLNSNVDNWDTGISFKEMKIYGTEYVAPETQAPETQAPETQAPETQAPETEAPETQAPETEAPETEAPADEFVNLVGCGEIIKSEAVTADVTGAFDGDLTTGAWLGGGNENLWMGIKLEQPAILSHVKLATPDTNGDGKTDRPHTIFRTIVEGSNDGETWTQLMDFGGDDYAEYEDYAANHEAGENYWTKYAEEPAAYTYYRVWNCDDSDNWGEVEFWGTLVEAPIDADVVFTLGDVAAQAGDTIEMEITVDSKVAANSIALYELTYDADVLTFVEFTGFGDMITNSFFGTDGVDNDQKIIMFALKDAAAINGAVAKIKFTVNEDAKNGDVEVSMKSLVKMNSEVIDSAVASATVSIGKFMLGDLDGNEDVNILDVLALFRYSMMPDMYPLNYAGTVDFDKNDDVNILDVLALFRYSMMPDMYPIG